MPYNAMQLEKLELDWANAYAFLFAAVQSDDQRNVDEAEQMIRELEEANRAEFYSDWD